MICSSCGGPEKNHDRNICISITEYNLRSFGKNLHIAHPWTDSFNFCCWECLISFAEKRKESENANLAHS